MHNGIDALVSVTQIKTNQANDEALHGADDQRNLVRKQKLVREAQQKLEQLVSSDGKFSLEEAQQVHNNINFLKSQGIAVEFDHITVWGEGKYDASGSQAEKNNNQEIERIKGLFDGMVKDLEAEDRLGNFEIQRLMSQYNQSEQLASSVQKKLDDTSNAVIGKVG